MEWKDYKKKLLKNPNVKKEYESFQTKFEKELNPLTLRTFKKTDEGKELNSYSKIEDLLNKIKCPSVLSILKKTSGRLITTQPAEKGKGPVLQFPDPKLRPGSMKRN